MALIGVLCSNEDKRRELCLAVEEMGHRAAAMTSLGETLELLAASKPQLLVVAAEPQDRMAEAFLAEAERVSPAMPVVVALTHRDASRAVELMRDGAAEVAAPPWTRENLTACVSKALRFRGTTFEVARPVESARRGAFYAVAVAAFLGVAFWYSTAVRKQRLAEEAVPKAPQTDWELPYWHPSGMAYGNGELWISDWYSQTIYRHDPVTLAVKRAAPLPAETPTAIALAGDALFVASQNGTVVKHLLDSTLTVLAKFPERLPNTVGMAYDGLYLWTLDGKAGRMRKHLPDTTLTALASYPYPGSRPAAIASDGKHLWTFDAGNREILEHDLDDPRRILYRLPLKEYRSGEWRPTGLAWDGTKFWTAGEAAGGLEKSGRVFRHEVAERARPR
ncbi:MAG: hypothetical protein HY078_09805 [Elusimicrobia bacterium]|nr:hypothetical protein [Elusimicrobiota bacterium]